MMIAVVAVVVGLLGVGPPPWSNASERARAVTAEVVPPLVTVTLPPPIQLPDIVVAFTQGQTSTQAAAAAAIDAATTSSSVRLKDSVLVSVIQMTGTIRALRTTPLRPLGRSGDLEVIRWSFADRFGRRIGDGNTLCRWATVARRLCWGEIRLPRGRLVLLGSSQTRGFGEFAVIGGTGVYTFRQGLLVFRQLSAKKYAIRVLLA